MVSVLYAVEASSLVFREKHRFEIAQKKDHL
jgi:hypothetical protein